VFRLIWPFQFGFDQTLIFAVSQDGSHGTDVPKRFKKWTCRNGQSDRIPGSGLEVTLYKRLSNDEAVPRVICGSSLPIALWPQVLRSLIFEQWLKKAFKLTPKS
jgi:hypothetical protein